MKEFLKKIWQALNRDITKRRDEIAKAMPDFKTNYEKFKAKSAENSIGFKKLGVVLETTDWDFEKKAVLNPACYQQGEYVHLYYRAIDDRGCSTIGYAKLKGPTQVVERRHAPLIAREFDYEKKGVEDPRIVKIENTYYMTYVAHDGKNAQTAYAISYDLKNWEKKGIISPLITYKRATSLFEKEMLKDRYLMFETFYEQESGADVLLWFKDAILFPQKINGKFAMLVRVLPDVQIVFFNDFEELKRQTFWHDYLKDLAKNVVLENKYWFESRNIGGGAPPVYTKDGWLEIFHGVEEMNKSRIYYGAAALLDKTNPLKVLGRSTEPLIAPEEEWEKTGYVNDVVFPTGTAIFKDDLYIYYGAADNRIAAAKVNIKKLVKKLKNGAV